MDLKKRKDSKNYLKKEKKLKKLINKSDSDADESEHELSYYLNDRVKLMKEVLKIIKPKKIKSMAPECLKKLDIHEINSMLLEELLGISNKRLKYIFNGQNLEEDSSSTDPEAEQQPIDVISLDDVTDDDFVIDLDSDNDKGKKKHRKHKPKIKEECKRKRIKKEKEDAADHGKSSKNTKEPSKDKMDEQNLMSVLELLELQARARAIRSQLVLENKKKVQQQKKEKKETRAVESDNDNDAVIIESPKNIEIVITSSESEDDNSASNLSQNGSAESESKDGNNRNSGASWGNPQKNGNDIKETPNSSKEPDNENKERLGTTTNNKQDKRRSENEKHCENIENESKSTRERSCARAKNKITNIETVIITPPKIVNPTSDVENDNETEKLVTLDSDDEMPDNKSKDLKAEKSKSEIYKTQSNAIDESDGIIINVEQSEIDCIISD